MGGSQGSQDSYQGARGHKGPGIYIVSFSLVFTFPQERLLARGAFSASSYTRDKQLFHLKIFF